MKKNIVFILLASVLGISCHKDYVELDPISSASSNNFYTSANDFLNAINATYGILQTFAFGTGEFIFGDLPSDDTYAYPGTCVSGHCDFDNYVVLPSATTAANVLNNRWNDLYRGISRANIVLTRIQNITMDNALKNRIIGEAKFLRAYFYFNLVRTFGDVPLSLTEITATADAFTYGREPASKVYAAIEKDLAEAAASLPVTYAAADAGRISNGAAKGMLARVLLYQKKYTDAALLLKGIIDSKTYGLAANYADVFRPDNGNNKEILFAVQYSKGGIGEGTPRYLAFAPINSGNSVQLGGGVSVNQPTPDIEAAFEPGDTRKDVSMANGYISANGAFVVNSYIKKYIDKTMTAVNEASTDMPVLRYADILLMYAECLNEAGQPGAALPYLGEVRNRAGLVNKIISTQDEMRLAIEQERRVELCFEGLRFFDLVRTGRLLPVMNSYFQKYNIINNGILVQVKDYQKVFPVPQSQIDINPAKIIQNQGY